MGSHVRKFPLDIVVGVHMYSQLTIVISDFDLQVTLGVTTSISEYFRLYLEIPAGIIDILQGYYPRSTYMHNELGYWREINIPPTASSK